MRPIDCKERSDAAAIDCREFDLETGEQIFHTKQEFQHECDINNILSRYTPEQIAERINAVKGVYGDFSNVLSYGDARQLVINAEAGFNALPAHIRRKFDNDPTKLIAYLDDSSNDAEAIELGLKERPETNHTEPLKESGEKVPSDLSLDV